jgi:septum formation protein
MSVDQSVWISQYPLILASKSKTRRQLLERAHFVPVIHVPEFDERAFEASIVAEFPDPADRARALASEKARLASLSFPQHYVIGADQILACDDTIVHKAQSLSHAKQQLAFLSGKTHHLISAFAIAQDGHILVEDHDIAHMTMREMTHEQIDQYCEQAGDAVLNNVGCYALEDLGVHLFERVEGDFFTVLGLPLERAIGFFRREGCLSL